MKRFYRSLRRFQPHTTWILLCILTFCLLFLQVKEQLTFASPVTSNKPRVAIPEKLLLDTRLPAASYNAHGNTNNMNAKFGSRCDFVISPGMHAVASGTYGIFHDNRAGDLFGIAPAGR